MGRLVNARKMERAITMITDFMQNPEVVELVEKANQLKIKKKRFSDLEDAERNQYVDLVQDGIRAQRAMVSTMRQIHDYDFLLKNPDCSKLICRIDADNEFNWLNFNMSKEEQILHFTLGVRIGLDFNEKFNWGEYKEIRRTGK